MVLYSRVFLKVRKTQHQNPEFGPKPGEIQEKPAKKYSSMVGRLRNAPFFVLNWVSSCFDPLFAIYVSASTATTYIFTAPTCTTTKTTLKPCSSYPDLINFHYFANLTQRRDRWWKEAQRQGDFKESSSIQKKLTSDLGVFQEEFQTGFNCTLAGCFSFYLFIYFLQVFQLHKVLYYTREDWKLCGIIFSNQL
jgi:hypothetical protein